MFSTIDKSNKNTQQVSWEQRLLKATGRTKTAPTPEYQELKFSLHRKLVDKINLDALASIDNQKMRSEVRQALLSLIDAEPTLLSSHEKQQICDEVLDEVFGLGPLEPLLKDPTISDILVNTAKHVYVERRGLLELTSVAFRDDQHLLRIIDKIVSQVGRRIDESTPMVDARLIDGSRVNAIIPPLAVDGPILSIRRFSTDKLMPADLVERRALTQGMIELLEAAVKAKLNIIIAGGSGAGKTTLLNALSVFINSKERVVTIEDAAELQLKQPHVVRLETRPANLEGGGAVRQRELLVNSLRMRPDRIVVGEVRGEKALTCCRP
jgi:pilus assembly protein CpaF